MPQISKIKLDKELELELFNQFWNSIGKINTYQKSTDSFSDILTPTEKIMIAKRFAAAILIKHGQSFTDIRNSIHLSYSAIGRISSWVNNARPETNKLLDSISKEKSLDSIFDKVDEILDKIPPRRGSDWKEEYAKRRIETRERYARKALR